MIQAYIPQIQALNPATTGCTYKTTVWSKLDEQHKNRIRNFENKWVSRAEVTQLYVEYFAGRADALSAFLLTMIWGFEYTGYGSYRTNKYLDSEENQQRIISALEAVQNNDIEKAFKELKKINGLGISYISKVLFFATKAKGLKEYCLIFDIRVARSLVMLTAPGYVNDIVSVMPSDKWEDYQKYNAMIHNLAANYQVEAESIELFLFDQKF